MFTNKKTIINKSPYLLIIVSFPNKDIERSAEYSKFKCPYQTVV